MCLLTCLAIFGLGCFILFLLYRYPYNPAKALNPKMRAVKRMLRKEIA
ncbi:hypothetical protein [Adhaeribacter soli]|nr:hypothetical protein [Adhaeribacter soli]